jgi:hypothetical protein
MKPFRYCIIAMSLLIAGCQPTPAKLSGDEAIRRVEACEFYRSVEGQKQKPWELEWDNAEKLREQFSHCVCRAHIDLRSVEDPGRYVVPGTVVK